MKAVRHFSDEFYASVLPALDPFTSQWSAAATVVTDYASDLGIGRRYFSVIGTTLIKAGYAWTRAGSIADVEIYGALMPFNEGVAGSRKLLIARGSGAAGAEQCYAAAFDMTANTIEIIKIVGGVITVLATAGLAYPAGFSRFRFSVAGTALKLRQWAQGAPEPTTWTHNITDASIASAGWAGVGISGVAGAGWGLALDWLAMGTAGDAAPVAPVLLTDYQNWLADDSKVRMVIVEADCLGRLSDGTANPSTLCVSNVPFVTQPEDLPANQCYEEIIVQAPTFTRRMDEQLKNRSTQSYGDLLLKNELDDNQLGRLDEMFTWNWDGREVRMWFGDPLWRKVDCRKVLRGSIQDVFCPEAKRLGLKLRDKSALLNVPIQTATVGGTGPNAGRLKPICLGFTFNVSPILSNPNALEYQVHDNQIYYVDDVRINGASLKHTGSISAVNSGTDTLTSVAHGLTAGCFVVFAGTVPAGISAGTPQAGPYYYVLASGLTADNFQVSAAVNGLPVDITNTTTGATWIGGAWQPNYANGKFVLIASTTGQITCDVYGHAPAGVWASTPQALLTHLLQDRAGVPVNDTAGAANIGAVQVTGMYLTDRTLISDAMDLLVRSIGGWWGFARSGEFVCGLFRLPTAVADYSLVQDDVTPDSFVLATRVLPTDPEYLGYQKNFTVQTQGIAGVVTDANRALYGAPNTVATFNPAEPSGLDVPGNHALRRKPIVRETLIAYQQDASDEGLRMNNIFSKSTAVFRFETLAMATLFDLGKTLNLTHARYGYAPGANGFIVGLAETYVPKVRSQVEMFAQLPGQWPYTTAANPYVDGTYFL